MQRWSSSQVLPRPLFESVFPDRCLLPLLGALQDPTYFFHSMTANIICSIVFGKRFGYRDPEFLRLLDLFYQSFTLISSFSSQVRETVWEGGHEVRLQGRGEGQWALGAQRCSFGLEGGLRLRVLAGGREGQETGTGELNMTRQR